jgi:His/Glu/Gln/Arg/opine family amino acid ABC transporter permease subunit
MTGWGIAPVFLDNLPYLLRAAGMTCLIALAVIPAATLFGAILALAAVFGAAPVRWLVHAYVFVVRGVPLLILLFVMYYALPYTGIDLPALQGGILVISLYYAAFMSEVFRAALLSLPRSQWDAGRCLGMRLMPLLRIVVFPQVIRLAAGPSINICMMIVKGTSLISVIGIWELTLAGREVVERTFAPFQVLGGVALIYFCICFTLATLGRRLEANTRYVH